MAYSNSSRALAFLTETSEDAIAALKGIIGGAGSAKYLDTSEDKVSLITTQIDSSRDEDRIVGLTRIVAMISKGRDASNFLPGVLKLTSSSNMEVRKLVYIILLRYANANPDLTLLSINSFQRDLSDPSPLIRAMALRVLSAIRVKMVSEIVLMSVSKATRDPNLYVRKVAALAIPKCYRLDKTQLPALITSLSTLLNDRSPLVLGAAIIAFHELCPERWDLLHTHYRKICHALSDIDEWSQVTCLHVLSRYARVNLAQPSIKSPAKPAKSDEALETEQSKLASDTTKPTAETGHQTQSQGQGSSALDKFLSGDNETPPAAPIASSSALTGSRDGLDRDLDLLLSKSDPLLHSRNPAVVMAAVRVIYYLAPPSRHSAIARPLIRLLRSPPEVVYVVLLNAHSIAHTSPKLFASHATSFFLGASHIEPTHTSLLKLDMLITICTPNNVSRILPEVITHVSSPSDAIAKHAVECLGRLAVQMDSERREQCLDALLDLLRQRGKKSSSRSIRDSVVAKAVLVIKDLIQRGDAKLDDQIAATIVRLSALLFGAQPSKTSTQAAGQAAAGSGTATPTAADPASTETTAPAPAPVVKKKKTKVVGKGAILDGSARASILWLLGQYCRVPLSNGKTIAEVILPDVLRRCALNFTHEPRESKLAILTTSTKAVTFLPTEASVAPAVTRIHDYLHRLARYDSDYDVRDRARLCQGLTAEPALKGVRLRREQVLLVLFEGQGRGEREPAGSTASVHAKAKLGSLALALDGKLIRGWNDATLPAWTEDPTDAECREPPATTATPAAPSLAASALGGAKSLSSADFTAPPSAPVVLVPSVTETAAPSPSPSPSAATSGRYRDLDAFLDESSDEEPDEEEEEEEMDASAPEDEDYAESEEEIEEDDDEEEEETDEE